MNEKKTEVDFSDISSRTVELLGSTWQVIDPHKMNRISQKNKDGYYRKSFTAGKRPDGSPIRVSIRAKTLRELDEKLAEAKRRSKDHNRE